MSSYTTKADVENYMGLSIDESLNEAVNSFIEAVSSWINNYCSTDEFSKRVFGETTNEVRYFDGNGKNKLYIDDAIEIKSAEFEYTDIKQIGDTELEWVAYPLNKTPKTYLRLRDHGKFIGGLGNVKIDAIWGYSETTPKDIKLAATKLTAAVIKENQETDTNEVKSVKFDDFSETYQDINKIADRLSVQKLLDSYKREDPDEEVTLGAIQV